MAPSEFRAQGSRAAPGESTRFAMTWEALVGSRKFVAAGARNSRGDGEDTAKNEGPRSGAFLSSGPYWRPDGEVFAIFR